MLSIQNNVTSITVIPAQAGIQSIFAMATGLWIPACAGMTGIIDTTYECTLAYIIYFDYNDFIDINEGITVASITIRNLDDAIKTKLRLRAALHGLSMEQEARDILRQSLLSTVNQLEFAQRIHQRFSNLALDDLPIPARHPVRNPPIPES